MYPFTPCSSLDTCPGVGLLDHMVGSPTVCGKESACSAGAAGDSGLMAWQPLQYSCLENPMDRVAGGLCWVAKSQV